MEETVEKVEQTGLIKYGENESKNKKTQRNSNLEILRILSMLMIVAHHYIVHSEIELFQAISLNKIIISFLEMGGKIGVNVFILITGYFLIEKHFKPEKVVKLGIKVFIYSMIGLTIAIINHSELLNIVTKICSFYPVLSEQYWFMTTYVLIYLFHPYINRLFFALNKKEVEKALIGLFVIWSIIPTFLFSNFGLNNLGWFIFIYLLGGYFKVYGNPLIENRKINIIVIVTITLILIITPIKLANLIEIYKTNENSIKNIVELYFAKKINDVYYFNEINSALIVALSLSYFSLFKNIKIKSNKIINSISSHTLGVYLMHDNTFVRELLWKEIIHCNTYIKSKIFILNAAISIPTIFIICLIIDYIVDIVLARNIYKIVDKILIKRIIKKIKKDKKR